MNRFRVVFDACVLYPAAVRDLLMELAVAGLYKSHWSDEIHDEWIRNVLDNRPDLTAERLANTRRHMDAYSQDALVDGYQYLIPTIELPDADDRHVVAAALHCRADAIITFNLKDFPREVMDALGLEAIHPDDFVTYQFDLDAPRTCESAKRVRSRLANPPYSPEEYVSHLRKSGLPRTADRYADWLALL